MTEFTVDLLSLGSGHGPELLGPRFADTELGRRPTAANATIVVVGPWQEAEMFARFNVAVSEWLGGSRGQVVVDAAVQALVDGVESPAIACLAGATRLNADAEANEWIPKIASEFGIAFPDRLSADGVLRAARVDAFRFLSDHAEDPRSLAARLWSRYVDSDYDESLAKASWLDDQYELIASGVIPECERSAADADARAIAKDLVATQLVGAPMMFGEFWIGDCGVVALDWHATAKNFRERTQVPAARANAGLASALAPAWDKRAVLTTYMHELLFIRPGYEPNVDPKLRVSWSANVFTFTLETRAGVVAADKCFEPNAPAVLAAFLCQLVGGDP